MRVAVGSIFRNAEPYLQRYAVQIRDLRQVLAARGDSLRLVLAEGDSADRTYDLLSNGMVGGVEKEVFKREHGGQDFGSVDNETRWKQSSYVWEGVLEKLKADDDVFLYLESDLIWDAETLAELISQTRWFEAVCPLVMYRGVFYDVWGYRAQGRKFDHHEPYHPMLDGSTTLYEMDSAGSCIAMRGKVARACHFDPADQAIVGFCQDLRSKGHKLWLDSRLSVFHPVM